jgi:hypothetical protein
MVIGAGTQVYGWCSSGWQLGQGAQLFIAWDDGSFGNAPVRYLSRLVEAA